MEETSVTRPRADEGQLTVNNSESHHTSKPTLFSKLSEQYIFDVGVPSDWVEDIRNATEDNFYDVAQPIPYEATEALMDYVGTGVLVVPNESAAEGVY